MSSPRVGVHRLSHFRRLGGEMVYGSVCGGAGGAKPCTKKQCGLGNVSAPSTRLVQQLTQPSPPRLPDIGSRGMGDPAQRRSRATGGRREVKPTQASDEPQGYEGGREPPLYARGNASRGRQSGCGRRGKRGAAGHPRAKGWTRSRREQGGRLTETRRREPERRPTCVSSAALRLSSKTRAAMPGFN